MRAKEHLYIWPEFSFVQTPGLNKILVVNNTSPREDSEIRNPI